MFKKLAMSMLSIAAITALVAGGTFALFTAQTGTQETVFSAGTVELGEYTSFECDVLSSNLAPGDSGNCEIEITYTGSLDAWIGVTAQGTGDLFAGATPMQITGYQALGGGAALDEVNGKYVMGKANGGNNDRFGVRITYSFPSEANNSYQEAEGGISVSFYAVQASHNTNGASTGPNSWDN